MKRRNPRATVLILSANPGVREVLASYLDREGHDVREAVDVDVARKELAGANAIVIDGLLLDHGSESIAELLQQRPRQLPVILLAPEGSGDEVAMAWRREGSPGIVLPFSPRAVTTHLRSLSEASGP